MAKAAHTTRTRAPKVTDDQANAFMCKLFDPLPDAELADPEIAKLENRAMKRRWNAGMWGVKAAKYLYEADIARRWFNRDYLAMSGQFDADGDPLRFEFLREYQRQLRLPAPDGTALKWKRAHAGNPIDDDLAAIIAADEARLSGRAS